MSLYRAPGAHLAGPAAAGYPRPRGHFLRVSSQQLCAATYSFAAMHSTHARFAKLMPPAATTSNLCLCQVEGGQKELQWQALCPTTK